MRAFISRARLTIRVLSAAALVAGTGAAGVARAQTAGAEQLPARLSTEARAVLQQLLDSARAVGIPTAPLADKAAEGVLKGADERRIVAAVQSLARQLGDAEAILGVDATSGPIASSLLGAAASALQAGVPRADLKRLAAAAPAPAAQSRPLVGALVTLVDLIAKHVSPATASASIEDLLRRRATEDHFAALRSDVAQDILGGQTPDGALANRTRAYVKALDGATAGQPAAPRRPPPAAPPPFMSK
jgi:hypothetical protein